MRYYPELKTIQLSTIHPYLWKEENEKTLLTEDGLYKYINETLYKFKIVPSSIIDTQPFIIQDIQFFPVGYNFQKKSEVTQIPPQHHFIVLHKKMYKLSENSATIFTVESIDNQIKDFYFESTEQFDNHSLREDLLSFLSLLK